nr:PAS domain-containing protein [Nitrosomonas sp.]
MRRFTPAAKVLLNLIDTDTNRPISNIRPNIVIPDLESELKQAIESAVTKSLEVQDDNGHWYLLRLHPYQKQDKNTDGVVMVFIGIEAIKDNEQLRNALQYERRLAAVVRDSNDAVTVQDFNGHILAWNQRTAEMVGYTEGEALQLNANQLVPDIAREEMRITSTRPKKHSLAKPHVALKKAICSRCG